MMNNCNSKNLRVNFIQIISSRLLASVITTSTIQATVATSVSSSSSSATSISTSSSISSSKPLPIQQTVPSYQLSQQILFKLNLNNNKTGSGGVFFNNYNKKLYHSMSDLRIKQTLLTNNNNMDVVNDYYHNLNNHHDDIISNNDENRQTYENAIIALNSLQSNASVVINSAAKKHQNSNPSKKDTERYLLKTGINMEQLTGLSVIHVSGTKGKGSTCALTESILRAFGVKTGFFSSPHLIDVTERIKLAGMSITKEKFTKYFWKTYDSLYCSRENDNDMPAYFKFLTIMAFHVFLEEKVDVAIIEVGIGGEHDCTNVLRHTKTAGITSLGLDHTQILGDTLSEIAWQKAGIIKLDSSVFTCQHQPNDCIDMLKKRSIEKNSKLHIVPEYSSYNWNTVNIKPSSTISAPPFHSIHQLNGSLAIQLSYDWLKRNSNKVKNKELIKRLNELPTNEMCLDVFDEVITGLGECNWPGRFQYTRFQNIQLFIDGAHTMESLSLCIDWFKQQIKSPNFSKNKNYILFNVTGDRDSDKMLKLLCESISFEMAIFTPNKAFKSKQLPNEWNNTKLDKQISCSDYWQEIQRRNIKNNINQKMVMIKSSNQNCSSKLDGDKYSNGHISTNTDENINIIDDDDKKSAKVFECISDAFDYLNKRGEINLLVTGSLHLVGAIIIREKHAQLAE